MDTNVYERVQGSWDDVVEDMEATAEEYREAGWAAIELHPGDVAAVPESDGQFGLDVLVPDDEMDDLAAVVDDGEDFDSFRAFRAGASGMVFLVVAMENEAEEVAVLVPAYYDPTDATEMLADARRRGELRTNVRTLSRDRMVTFVQADPAPLLPPTDDADEDE